MNNSRLIEMTLHETQMASLEVLKKIDSICREHNIKYFLFYGSLIGAVRHKGFIPWDDDLDIGMLREDYDRFCQYCIQNKESLWPYCLDNGDTVDNVPFGLSRFCNTDYVLKFKQYKTYKESGIFVDIYPFDAIGTDNDIEYWKKVAFRRFTIRQSIYFASMKSLFYGKNLLVKIETLPFIINSKFHNSNYFIGKIKKYAFHFNMEDSDYVGCVMWTHEKMIPSYRKLWLEDLIYTDFEDIKVPIPKEYDAILKKDYGDYMAFPPEDERHPYHGYTPYRKV